MVLVVYSDDMHGLSVLLTYPSGEEGCLYLIKLFLPAFAGLEEDEGGVSTL